MRVQHRLPRTEMQVMQFIQSRGSNAISMPVDRFRKSLADLAAGTSPQCAFFIEQLQHAANAVGTQGRGSVSRATVRALVTHYGNTVLPAQVAQQQALIRSSRGAKLALDNSYKSASSLAGLWHGRLLQHKASLLTVTCEDGLVVLAVIVPNDGHEWQCLALRCLHGVVPGNEPWHAEVYARAALGGPLGKYPRDICTDHVARDRHLWEKVAEDITLEALDRDLEILIPSGALCCVRTTSYCCAAIEHFLTLIVALSWCNMTETSGPEPVDRCFPLPQFTLSSILLLGVTSALGSACRSMARGRRQRLQLPCRRQGH